jgi:hypothetical protein
MTVMEDLLGRRREINSILGFYADFLNELSDILEKKGITIGYAAVRARAFKLLDETLTSRELDGILLVEGDLRGRFPGVERRLKELLRMGIAGSLYSRGE